MTPTTRELCLKLVRSLHLSVPERSLLPGGRAPLSEVVGAIGDCLEADGWFPFALPLDGVIGEGALLEHRNGQVWVHEQHEVGLGRYSPVHSYRAPNLVAAVRAYVEAQGGEVAKGRASIDGVPIDLSA